MPRVVPSQVVDIIDNLFPQAKAEQLGRPTVLNFDNLAAVTALIDLIENISDELLPLDATQYTEFVCSVAALKSRARVWETIGNTQPLMLISGLRRHSPVALIRQALAKCPEAFPNVGTTEVNFIRAAPLRKNIRLDISTAYSALGNGEWKAATVIAGSVVEALLLWALERKTRQKISAAIAQLNRKLNSNIQKWDLADYIDVAEVLKIIKPETVSQCRLAKHFRNLIHPGRAQRLGQPCNRGTALSAVAAVEHVVGDLTP